jgi:hypothetical protein
MDAQTFYWVDLAIAVAIPVLFAVLYLTRRIGHFNWLLYWAGCAVGALWEIPFYFIGPDFSTDPLYLLSAPIPYPLFLLHLLHCFWDGGLFMTGVLLVNLLLKAPHFVRFSWKELLIMLAWGGLQELAVELASVGSSGWAFVPRWWNPVMFRFQGGDVTLIPQLIWVAAPVVFYLVALRVKGSLKSA